MNLFAEITNCLDSSTKNSDNQKYLKHLIFKTLCLGLLAYENIFAMFAHRFPEGSQLLIQTFLSESVTASKQS